MSSRSGLGTAVLAGLAWGALAAGAPASVADARLDLDVAFGHDVVHATLGSSCLDGTASGGRDGGRCTDAHYPLQTAGVLHLEARKQIRMRFGALPSRVEVRLLSEGFATDPPVLEAKALRLARDPHRFRVTLPAAVPCATIADVLATYSDGDADFWAAIATPGCGPAASDDAPAGSGARGRHKRPRRQHH